MPSSAVSKISVNQHSIGIHIHQPVKHHSANGRQMTLRDIVPILEDLRQLTKVPLVAKQDTILSKRIAEASNRLCSIDIENAIIESHTSGELGKVQADQPRHYCAEIATSLLTFWTVFDTSISKSLPRWRFVKSPTSLPRT